jgi:ferredoxin-thioredoxin reductase catalytic subunit
MAIDPDRVTATMHKLHDEAENGGYHLNPDEAFTRKLVEGLLINQDRYGYQSCPCRLASGNKDEDLDIVCPCDYRDPDLHDYGACYCALYVSSSILRGEAEVMPVPERRPAVRPRPSTTSAPPGLHLWRCRVCGYLCVREHPPEVCPVCKAHRDRFEVFVLPTGAIPTT